jgi:hypothetical protein
MATQRKIVITRINAVRLLSLGLLVWLLSACTEGGSLQEVRVELQVDLPLAQSWDKLRDFSSAHNYVPGIERTEIVSAQANGWGARRRVYNSDGGYLEETVVEWTEGSGFVIDLHRGEAPMEPFNLAQFIYQLAAQGEDNTRVTLALRFEMPLGSFGATLGDWFVKPLMEDELVQVGAGLKHFYETGTPATDADRERLAGAVSRGR